jgi:hypothetical protein
VVAGVRQRFRLPSRRPLAWTAAVLLALVLGAFGAAAGSLAAAQTMAGLPTRDAFSAVSRLAGDGIDRWEQRDTTPHGQPSWRSDVDDPGWSAAEAREAVARTGWTLTPAGEQPLPWRHTAFDGTRDGLHLRVVGNVTGGHDLVSVMVWPEDNVARWPVTVAGAAAGLLAGWLLAAALAYRLRRIPSGPRHLAAGLATTTLAAWLVPAAACYANLGLMVRAAGDEDTPTMVYRAFAAGPFETWGWTWMIAQLGVAGLLLGLSGVAVAWWKGAQGAGVAATAPG